MLTNTETVSHRPSSSTAPDRKYNVVTLIRGAEYDWDQHNEGHIAVHGVERNEVEEVLANGPVYIETRIDPRSGEERILELGHTNAGRVLFVAWTPRGKRTRPVTAFDADRKTRARYHKETT
jgi:uncharacterized protein